MAATILSAIAATVSLSTLVLVLFFRLPDHGFFWANPARKAEGLPERTGESEPLAPASAPNWLEQVTKKKIIVHTKDDKSIEGVLWATTEDEVILRAAKLLADKSQAEVVMAGETCIPRANVSFAQLDD